MAAESWAGVGACALVLVLLFTWARQAGMEVFCTSFGLLQPCLALKLHVALAGRDPARRRRSVSRGFAAGGQGSRMQTPYKQPE